MKPIPVKFLQKKKICTSWNELQRHVKNILAHELLGTNRVINSFADP
jgi:hypothetical protein